MNKLAKYLKVGAYAAFVIVAGTYAAVKENAKVATLNQARITPLCEVSPKHEECVARERMTASIEWTWNGEVMRVDAR